MSRLHRRMRNSSFRQEQWNRRFASHVAAINSLVDDLRREASGRVPYVAPLYGGDEAEVLFIFQDPGPGTDETASGSGFLCSENDDPSAQLFAECLDTAGLDAGRVITWNAYPWSLPPGRSSPTAGQREAGVEPLKRLLALLPKLKVVATMGRVAQDGWSRFLRRYPAVGRRYKVIPGLHTSRRGITSGGQHTKAEGVYQVLEVMREARQFVDAKSHPA